MFATHGLDAPVEEIALSAGVGMGTLYRRFPTKEALIEELARKLCAELLEAARGAGPEPDGDGLERYLREAGAVLEAHGSCMSRLWNGAVTPDLLAELDGLVESLLDAAKAGGRIRADASTTDVTVLFWSIRGIVETAGDAAPGAWKRHLDMVLAGLRPGSDALAHEPLSLDQRQAARARELPPPGPGPDPGSRPDGVSASGGPSRRRC